MSGRRGKRFAVVLAVAAVALVCAAVASAGHWKVKATQPGTAAAAAGVLHQSDLGSGWKGSGATPNLESALCTGAKQSPVPAIGAARIEWKNSHLITGVTSQAVVLSSAKLVSQDWKKTVLAKGVLACTKKSAAKALPSSEKLLSLGWTKVPKLTKYTRDARALVSLKGVKVVVDLVVIGTGKDELTLTFTTPQLLQSRLHSLELKVARKLLKRLASK